jgi:hypothetical protein
MGLIRALRREDIPQVADLYELVTRSGSAVAPPGLAGYFERILLGHPWVDPEIPSLVYLDEHGQVAGFIGSHVRHMAFKGRRIRAALSGQLVSHPAVRGRAVGTLLLRKYLSGPQDLTLTSAGGETTRIWRALGGSIAHLNSISWMRALHWRAAGELALDRAGGATWAPVVRPVLSLGQAVADRIPATSLRVPEPPTRAELLTPRALLDQLPPVSDHLLLRPDYDEAFLKWLFQEMAEVTALGNLTRSLIRDQRDRVLGWYVSYFKEGGIGQVMQIAAQERDIGAVIDHLFHEARRAGVAILSGQLEPPLFEPLSQRRCVLHRLSGNVLVHSRDPEIAGSVLLGQALLTRMDGERWMGHPMQPFTSQRADQEAR